MHSTKKTGLIAGIAAALAPFSVWAATTTWDANSTGLNETAGAANIGTSTSLAVIIGIVIKAALGLVGVIFLVLMVYAGYMWMIARGDEGKVDTAKETITRAIIGIVIVLGAYALTSFVIDRLANAGGSGTTTTTQQTTTGTTP